MAKMKNERKDGKEIKKHNEDNQENIKKENLDKEEKNEEKKEETNKEVNNKTEEESWNAKYLRLMAEFQNFKKRAETEKSGIYDRANERIIIELLSVIDNFERALGSVEDSVDKKFVEGVELILKQLLTVLEKEGVEEIKALGQDFDPNFHNAVMTESSEEYEEGKISDVLQKGYMLKGKVIRPSMVKVVK